MTDRDVGMFDISLGSNGFAPCPAGRRGPPARIGGNLNLGDATAFVMLLPDLSGPRLLGGETDNVSVLKRRAVKGKRFWPDYETGSGRRLTYELFTRGASLDEPFMDEVQDSGSDRAATHADCACEIVRAFQTDPRLELAVFDGSSQSVADRFS